MLKIQESFATLLRNTGAFFTAEGQDAARDHKSLDSLRQGALEFIKEVNEPSADRFLAYLLTVNLVESHYPLHCLRMAALVARALRQDPTATPADIEKIGTAAFFADIGFRVAWLGSKGNHRDVAAYHMKDMSLSWFTPDVTKLILGHHTVSGDTSPHKILSLVSRYLALTQGTGVDQSPVQLLSPTQALDVLIQESGERREAMKLILKVLSAYPVGSWVELNSGQLGLVLRPNGQVPLRPILGMYGPPSGPGTPQPSMVEQDLSRDRTLQIVREKNPGPCQQVWMDNPQAWVLGWEGGAPVANEDIRRAFDPDSAGAPTEGLSNHASTVEEFWADRKPAPAAPPTLVDAKSPMAFDVQMDELTSLRTDWERRVQMAEDMVGKLKMGLLDSYKRENDKYKNLLDKLARTAAASSTAPAVSSDNPDPAPKKDGSVNPAEKSLAFLHQEIDRMLQSARQQLRRIQNDLQAERNAIQALFAAVRETVRFLHRLYTEHNAELGAAHDAMAEIMERWENQLERLESVVVQTPSIPRSVTEFELEETAARSLMEELSRQGSAAGSPEASDQYSKRWIGTLAPGLQNHLAVAQKDLIDSLHALTGPRNGIEQLKAQGDRLKTVLLSKIVLSYVARGIARREVGDNAAAIAYFKRAIDLQPEFWQAHAFLGLCYLSGKDDRASAEFKAAAAANPGHKDLDACLGLAGGGPAQRRI